jgi:integrase/recombinase XerD
MPVRQRAHIYQRGPVYWARITIAGIEHRRSLSTRDERVARRRAEKWREDLLAARLWGEHRATWQEVFIAWSKHIVTHVGPATARRYAVSLAQLEPLLSALYLDQIDRRLMSDIVTKRRAAGASTATIRRDLTALSSVLAFAQDPPFDYEGNPALDRMRKLRERRDPITLPEAADLERVIARAPGALAALIRAAAETGCRQNELVTAARRQVDWERRQLVIIGKGRKRRAVPLSGAALATLRSVPASLTEPWLFHHDGEPYRNVSSRFRELVKSAQKSAQQKGEPFRPFRFHDLRHLFAVTHLKRGGGLYDLQQILGHGSIKTTEIYLSFLTPEESAGAKAGRAPAAQNTAQRERFDHPQNGESPLLYKEL